MKYKPHNENGDGDCASFWSRSEHDPFSTDTLEKIQIYIPYNTQIDLNSLT